MRIAVHYNDHLHEANFAFDWIKQLEKNNIQIKKVDFYKHDAINQVKDCDGVMWNWFHLPLDKITAPYVLHTIESILDLPVFPNLATRWHFDEKVAQHYFFQAKNYPAIKSWVFHNYQEAINFAENSLYPIVFKLSVGASSSNVTIVNNKKEAINIINRIFSKGIEPNRNNIDDIKRGESLIQTLKNKFSKFDYPIIQKEYVYFQEYLPNNQYDIRVNVIGDRIFAFVRYNRDNDFRASGSGKIDYNKDLIPMEVLKIAYQISKENNFQSMAYDFLRDSSGKYLINEISYTYRSLPVTDCNGYWNPDLKFINTRISPEEAIVEDFIKYIKQSK